MKMGSFLVWERGLNTHSKKCRHLTMFDNEYPHISKDLEDCKKSFQYKSKLQNFYVVSFKPVLKVMLNET